MGVLVGFYASDVMRPAIWVVWAVFVLSAFTFIFEARLEIKRPLTRHEPEKMQPTKDIVTRPDENASLG